MADSKKPKKDNVTRNLVIGMISLVVVVGVAVSFGSNKAKESAATPSSVEKSEGYGIVFNKGLTGVPKVDIWEDFQCPVCRDFEAVNVKQIKQWIDDKKIIAIFHPLSFIGAESAYMANAAACSADEGKFLQVHEALYANQAATENSGKWSPQALIGLGIELKLNSKNWSECVTSGKYQDWVNNVAADGAKKNVNSTPTVFINGKEMERTSANYFTADGFKKQVFNS
jgi:protein-disulfide isomerase